MKEIVLLLFMLSATLAWGQSKKERQVAAAMQELHDALVSLDSNQLKRLTATDLRFTHSSGATEDRQTFINNAVNGPFRFLSITTTDQKITVRNRVAEVNYILIAKATSNGAPTDLTLRVAQRWKKNRGAWKLVSRQATKR